LSGEQDFWARRRAGVAEESKAEQAALEAQALAEEHAALEEMSDPEILAELDLPDPDTMVQGDDFSVFMAKAVPDQIRRRALRTLWRSNPVLANVDMLVDYGEDFTDAALAVENIQTAYQVGKGMLKHVEEMARQAEERENPTIVEEPDLEEIDEDEILSAEAEETPQDVEDAPEQNAALDEEEAYIAPTPRRMKFRIEEHA
jgi:hypothetical protein